MAKKPAQSPASPLSTPSIEPDQLSSVLEALGAMRARHQVRVYRISEETGHPQAVRNGRFAGDKCDEYVVSERYGGGEYRCDVIDPAGRIIRQVRVYVPADVQPAAELVQEVVRPDGIGELRSELSQLRDLVQRITVPPPPAGGIDLNGFAALMTAMAASQPKLTDLAALFARQPASPVGEVMEAVERLAKMRGLGASEPREDPDDDDGEDGDPIAAIVMDVLDGIKSDREQKRDTPRDAPRERVAPPSASAPPAKVVPSSPVAKLALLMASSAEAETDPDLCAHVVAEFVGRHGAALMQSFDLQRNMAAQLIERAPGLARHRGYIDQVEQVLRAMAARTQQAPTQSGEAAESEDDDDDGSDDGE